MRMQLTAFAWLLLIGQLPGGPALAQSRASSRVDVYADDWITVVSPAGMASLELGEKLTAEAGFAADMLSGATQVLTADLVTSATQFSETRYEGHVSTQLRPVPSATVQGSYGFSAESDYRTQTAGLGGSLDVFERSGTVAAAYHLSLERVGTARTTGIAETSIGHILDLSWDHLLSPRSSLSVLLTGMFHQCGAALGCQASPYRYVALSRDDLAVMAVRERHPERRARAAASLRYRRKLGRGLALHAGSRFYGDSWRVTGTTADLSFAKPIRGEQLILRLDGRYTWQSAAFFYRDRYVLGLDTGDGGMVSIPAFRSADRELSGLHNVLAGVRAEAAFPAVGPFMRLGMTARVARLWYRYPDFSELPSRDAWLLGGGAYAEF